MNLYELNTLITSLDTDKDLELLEFYKKKKIELIKEIKQKINKEIKTL